MSQQVKVIKYWLGGLTLVVFLGILVFGIAPQVRAASSCFPDVSTNHWAEPFICFLKNNGITGGYQDGTYRPGNNVTRAEMAVFIKNIYDLAQSNDSDTLAGLSCSKDQIAKWDGSSWVCQPDQTGSGSGSSPLDSLSCAAGEVAAWDGGAWVCYDLGTDFYTESEVDSMLAAKESRIQALETKLASVSVQNGGDDFVFTGVNVHLRDGSGDTHGSTNGLGNLIVGYNENSGGSAARSGSHNVVVGTDLSYSSFGGLVVGDENTISVAYGSVVGGYDNSASGYSSVVVGGQDNVASNMYAVVSGGEFNKASGIYSSVSGGYNNEASGGYSHVSGGESNEAAGQDSVIGGGKSRTVSGDNDWQAGSLFETD